jgi:ribosomal protein S18 acetylase RimI-like enzyme
MRVLRALFFHNLTTRRNSMALFTTTSTVEISTPSSLSGVTIRELAGEDVQVTAKLISDAFPLTNTHSWGRALGLTSNMEGYMTTYLPTPLSRRLGGLGAYIADSCSPAEKLVGATILEDYEVFSPTPAAATPSSTDEDTVTDTTTDQDTVISAAFSAIEGLINECKVVFQREFVRRRCAAIPGESNSQSLTSSKIGYVAWIATDETYRGNGIANALVDAGCKALESQGYEWSTAFCVSPTATRVFLRQGYELWGEVPYASFTMPDGTKPYSVLPDEVSVVVKRLASTTSQQNTVN